MSDQPLRASGYPVADLLLPEGHQFELEHGRTFNVGQLLELLAQLPITASVYLADHTTDDGMLTRCRRCTRVYQSVAPTRMLVLY